MKDFLRLLGLTVIALILVSVPGLLVASFVFEWNIFLKMLFGAVTGSEVVTIANLMYEWGEDEHTDS